jgi:hypothetical protein
MTPVDNLIRVVTAAAAPNATSGSDQPASGSWVHGPNGYRSVPSAISRCSPK